MKRETLSLFAALGTVMGGSWCFLHCALAPKAPPREAVPVAVSAPDKEHSQLHRHREPEAKVGGDTAPDGTAVQIDLPADKRMHNVGGRDGAGLCVFTSLNHAAIWQNVDVLKDFQKWMRSKPGGGYPEKVTRMINRKSQEAGIEAPPFVQVEGSDLEVIQLACATGRMPCVTYGFSPSGRYGGQRISHMVNCVHADGRNCAVLDNNYPEQLEWLSEEEFRRAYAADGGWTVVLLKPGPPPPPRNKRK